MNQGHGEHFKSCHNFCHAISYVYIYSTDSVTYMQASIIQKCQQRRKFARRKRARYVRDANQWE